LYPQEIKMTRSRIPFLLVGSFLLSGILHADDKKPEIPKVTIEDLKKDPEKYHGKLIQIEGTLASDPMASKSRSLKYYLHIVEADDFLVTSDTAISQRDVAKGDRVLITGTFRYSENPSGKLNLGMRIQAKDGKVEKLEPKKP
jgi:hypothetical protein